MKTHEDVNFPLDLTIHKGTDAVVQRLEVLCLEFGLLYNKRQRDLLKGVGRLGGYCYTTCGEEELFFGSLHMVWLFFFDDLFDEDTYQNFGGQWSDHLVRMVHIIKHGALQADAPGASEPNALEKFGLYVRNVAIKLAGKNKDVLQAYIDDCVEYMTEGIPTAMATDKHKLLSLDEYRPLRLINGAVLPCITLYAIAYRLPLNKEMLYNDVVKKLRELTTYIIVYANDIFSYQREVYLAKKTFNSLYIRAQSMPFRKALHEQVEEINNWVNDFKQLKTKIEHNPVLVQYTQGMEFIIKGTEVWSKGSSRYKFSLDTLIEAEVVAVEQARV
jgi:hypothetical protein